MEDAQQDTLQREEAAYHRYVAAKDATRSIRNRLEALIAILTSESAPASEQITRLLDRCEASIQAQEAANRELLERIHPAARKSPLAAGLAAKVFATTEVLEHILFYLSLRELLPMYGVSKTFYDTIEGSIKL